MPNALAVMNLAIYKVILVLEDSEIKIAGNIVFIEQNKQFLTAINCKSFQGITAIV